MNFEQKLDVVIREITLIYGLNDKQANLVKQNVVSRVNMYKNIKLDFTTNETRIVQNSSSIGDFFINRLVTNIRNYDFDINYNKLNTLMGAYFPEKQEIYVGNYKFIRDITFDRLKNRISNVDDDTLRKASLNVFNHELGHALQTSFKGRYGDNDTLYSQLINNLCSKYPDDFKIQASDEKLAFRQKGMNIVHKNDKSKEARDFYAKNAYTTYVDEIFNEDEALKITGVSKPQISYNMGNGFSKNIYNYQSSNYKITSYGKMMKIIMGKDLTFKAMYEDSIVAYEFFDQFKDISDSIYHGKPPMFNVLESLNQIRTKSSLDESLKLELFLTNCLRVKVINELKSSFLTKENINKIRPYVLEFSNQMTRNPNFITKQDTIISNINNMINEREKIINNNNFEKNEGFKKNDDSVKHDLQVSSQMQSKMITDRIKVTPAKCDSMNFDEKRRFIQYKMSEAKSLKDEDEYYYWNANLKSLESKINDKTVEIENNHSKDSNVNNYAKPQKMEVNKDCNYYFDEIIKILSKCNTDVKLTQEQKKQLIGEIFYNESFLIGSLTNGKEIAQIMFRCVDELSNDKLQIKLQKIILRDMQNKCESLYPKTNKQSISSQIFSEKNGSNISYLIEQLKFELNKIQNRYRLIAADGYFDSDELATLLRIVDQVINDGYSLKLLANDPNDLRSISIIIDELEEEQNKIKKIQNDDERIGRSRM